LIEIGPSRRRMDVTVIKKRVEGRVWRFLRLSRKGSQTSVTRETEQWISFPTSDGSIFTALYLFGPTTQSPLHSNGTLGWQPIISTEHETFCAIELCPTYPAEDDREPHPPAGTHQLDLTEMPSRNENLFLNYAWRMALEESPRIILKETSRSLKLNAYYLCLPKSIALPQTVDIAMLPNFPPNLQIANFKPSRQGFKFIYNHLVRANTATPSPWCPSSDGTWLLLTRRLANSTYDKLIERILRTG